ncbi:hypothetical protein FNV43_RR13108 [Rhamnella rubrinervis]|uniref:Uncharacterized protein n=1 Tax=Rhamnella rubrinervis TaxID=2594499 RepID=A0A8K0H0G9_9ROSA|nr:hypothetical protein FNV43_RR13108 [Rhamnella rubrinervis]
MEVSCLHILKGSIRLLYGEPTDPLWASYLAIDMGKLKMKMPSEAELEALRKKKRTKSSTIRTTYLQLTQSWRPFCYYHNILKGMTFEEINLEFEQSALKLAKSSWYLYDAYIKAESAYKKKVEAYNSIAATNKTLEENNLKLKQIVVDSTNRAEKLEKKWFEVDLGLIEKEKELEALRLDFAKLASSPSHNPDPNQTAPEDSFKEAIRLVPMEEDG